MTKRTCRACGCSQNRPCIDEKASALDIEPIGCHWVGKDLCNVCDDRAATTVAKLTTRQQWLLNRLITRKAISKASAYFGDDTNPRLVSRLVEQGLAEKHTFVRSRASRTKYWITSLGREVLRRAREELRRAA